MLTWKCLSLSPGPDIPWEQRKQCHHVHPSPTRRVFWVLLQCLLKYLPKVARDKGCAWQMSSSSSGGHHSLDLIGSPWEGDTKSRVLQSNATSSSNCLTSADSYNHPPVLCPNRLVVSPAHSPYFGRQSDHMEVLVPWFVVLWYHVLNVIWLDTGPRSLPLTLTFIVSSWACFCSCGLDLAPPSLFHGHSQVPCLTILCVILSPYCSIWSLMPIWWGVIFASWYILPWFHLLCANWLNIRQTSLAWVGFDIVHFLLS